MYLQIIKIDAWRYDDGWIYNNTFPLEKIKVDWEPTKRRILKLLREKGYIGPKSIYQVDDYFTFEGTWCVQRRNGEPLYDVMEMR